MPRRFQYRTLAKKMGVAPKSARKVATVQTVKRMISKSSEGKKHDVSFSSSTGNTWGVAVLSNMVRGDTVNHRIGDKISPTYLKYRLNMAVHASNTLGDVVRVVIFADKEARGVLPTMSNLNLHDAPDGGTNIALKTDNQYSRYKILSDKTYNMTTDNNFQVKSGAIKLKSPIKFGTDGDDYQENSIFIAVWTYDDTNKTTVSGFTRLFFKDP